MKPDPEKARQVLELAVGTWTKRDKIDLFVAMSEALGLLRGYEPSEEVLAKYRCTFCGISGVKLWRAVHSAEEAWCCKCGTAQAGLPDTINENGKLASSVMDGQLTDQIYSPHQGCNLLPWVPCVDGGTWGYTSVPPEGCEWWRNLPTRKE